VVVGPFLRPNTQYATEPVVLAVPKICQSLRGPRIWSSVRWAMSRRVSVAMTAWTATAAAVILVFCFPVRAMVASLPATPRPGQPGSQQPGQVRGRVEQVRVGIGARPERGLGIECLFDPQAYPGPMPAYAPPGWPHEVRPPDAPGWEQTASAWLLDQCPPEFRGYPALRHHLVVLARLAVLHVEACQAGVRRGLSEARASLRDVTIPDVADRAVETLLAEDARLAGVHRAVGLVEEAVRGTRYRARL